MLFNVKITMKSSCVGTNRPSFLKVGTRDHLHCFPWHSGLDHPPGAQWRSFQHNTDKDHPTECPSAGRTRQLVELQRRRRTSAAYTQTRTDEGRDWHLKRCTITTSYKDFVFDIFNNNAMMTSHHQTSTLSISQLDIKHDITYRIFKW